MLQVLESHKDITTFFEMAIFSDETKKRVRDATLILLPEIGVYEGFQKAFRPNTKSFYRFATTKQKVNYSVEMFENEGEEQIISFHSWDLYLPILYLRKKELLPNVIDLVHAYADSRTRHGRYDKVVNLIITVEEGRMCKTYTYKGLNSELIEAFKQKMEK